MLFHVDMIYLAKQAKRNVEKNFAKEMRTVAKSNPERDFFNFMSKRRKYAAVFYSLSSEQEHFTHGMYIRALIRPSGEKIEPIMFNDGMMQTFSGAVPTSTSR